MKDEVWAALPPREQDAKMAEAFGFDIRGWKHPWVLDCQFWNEGTGSWMTVPEYASTGNGMMLVIDAMRAKGWEVSINWQFHADDKWQVRFARFENSMSPGVPGEWVNWQARADSAPSAIALAAVRARQGSAK